MTFFSFASDPPSSDVPEAPFDPLKYPVRLLGAQIALATTLGVSAFLSFCILRRAYPRFYEGRRTVNSTYNTVFFFFLVHFRCIDSVLLLFYAHVLILPQHLENLPPLSGSLFGWLRSLYLITDEQVLEHAGLDAFVVSIVVVFILLMRSH